MFACYMYLSEYSHYRGLPGGLWSTLNIQNAQHDLAVMLSDIHLAYRGNCTYGLLCKQANLWTIGEAINGTQN